MKTSNTTNTNAASNSRSMVQSLLVIVGIMTAIICSLVLLNKSHSQQAGAKTFNVVKASGASITEKVVKDLSVASLISDIVKF